MSVLRPLTLMITLAAISAAPAAADPPAQGTRDEPRVQFVDMSAMLIDGEVVRPKGLRFDAREKVKFDRLFELKRAVLPRLRETARDSALR